MFSFEMTPDRIQFEFCNLEYKTDQQCFFFFSQHIKYIRCEALSVLNEIF